MEDNQIVKTQQEVKCPFCGAQSYVINGQEKICINVKPVIRDGILINKHPDGKQFTARCNKCKQVFTYRFQLFSPENSSTAPVVGNKPKEVVQETKESVSTTPKTSATQEKVSSTKVDPVKKTTVKKTTTSTKSKVKNNAK